LDPACTFWTQRGYPEDFPEKYKEIIWSAMILVPYDEIANETGVVLSASNISVHTSEYHGDEFEQYVKGYGDWPDDKKKRFQKFYFKWRNNTKSQVSLLKTTINTLAGVFEDNE
jgi:hypothetical protein